jgi:hypothetical protein
MSTNRLFREINARGEGVAWARSLENPRGMKPEHRRHRTTFSLFTGDKSQQLMEVSMDPQITVTCQGDIYRLL